MADLFKPDMDQYRDPAEPVFGRRFQDYQQENEEEREVSIYVNMFKSSL